MGLVHKLLLDNAKERNVELVFDIKGDFHGDLGLHADLSIVDYMDIIKLLDKAKDSKHKKVIIHL